jgi:hypothetical protein
MLITVKLFCFSYVVSSDYIWLCAAQGRQIKHLANLKNLELIRGNHIRETKQLYCEQQIPSPQQPVHLMMAS